MSRVEEFPDDYDTSIPLPQPALTSNEITSGVDTTEIIGSRHGIQGSGQPKNVSLRERAPMAGPTPPPTQSVDDVVADLQKSPFFMTSLPHKSASQDADEDPEENVELAAMQALQYEGTRAEIAGNFRETGNEMAKVKKWSDAREYYNKALAAMKVERGEEERKELKEKGISEEKEDKKEREIEIACLGNRALCQLELSALSQFHILNSLFSQACPSRGSLTFDPHPQKTTAPAPSTAKSS